MDDLQAIIQLKRGDIHGLDYLIIRYQLRAVRVAYLITQDAALAEDIVQDVFLNVYRSIRHFDTRRPFAPWLMRSVVNAALKHGQRRRDQSLEADLDYAEFVADPASSLDDRLDTVVLEQTIWEALGALSPEQRTVIVLRFYLELGEAEMADYLNIPAGTVKSRLYAARQQLKLLLQPQQER